MRGVAQAEGDGVIVQPLKAVRVELQADLAPHVCSIDVLAFPARQGPALPQDEIVSILHTYKLRDSFALLHCPSSQKRDIDLLLALLMTVCKAQQSQIPLSRKLSEGGVCRRAQARESSSYACISECKVALRLTCGVQDMGERPVQGGRRPWGAPRSGRSPCGAAGCPGRAAPR